MSKEPSKLFSETTCTESAWHIPALIPRGFRPKLRSVKRRGAGEALKTTFCLSAQREFEVV